jgi:poly-D-alanine transfer protein DltD
MMMITFNNPLFVSIMTINSRTSIMAKQTTSKLYKERGIGKEGATYILELTDMINRPFLNKLTVHTATRSFLKMTIVVRRYSYKLNIRPTHCRTERFTAVRV